MTPPPKVDSGPSFFGSLIRYSHPSVGSAYPSSTFSTSILSPARPLTDQVPPPRIEFCMRHSSALRGVHNQLEQRPANLPSSALPCSPHPAFTPPPGPGLFRDKGDVLIISIKPLFVNCLMS